jgi:hypothetical protein
MLVLPQLGQANITPLSRGANTQLVMLSEGGDGPWSLAPLIDIDAKKATILKFNPAQPLALSMAENLLNRGVEKHSRGGRAAQGAGQNIPDSRARPSYPVPVKGAWVQRRESRRTDPTPGAIFAPKTVPSFVMYNLAFQ